MNDPPLIGSGTYNTLDIPGINLGRPRFGEHLGDNAGDLNAPWAAFMGNQTTVRNFYIDNQPIGEAYLILQLFDVHSSCTLIELIETKQHFANIINFKS